MRTKAQLITASVSVKNVDKAVPFYSTLLGVELARSLTNDLVSYHAIAASGVQFGLNQQRANETVVCSFEVDDLSGMIAELQAAGGKLVAGPFPLNIAPDALDDLTNTYRAFGGKQQVRNALGTTAIVQDPEGNSVALVQLAPFAQEAFRRGELTDDDFRDHEAALKHGRRIGKGPH